MYCLSCAAFSSTPTGPFIMCYVIVRTFSITSVAQGLVLMALDEEVLGLMPGSTNLGNASQLAQFLVCGVSASGVNSVVLDALFREIISFIPGNWFSCLVYYHYLTNS